MMNTKTISLAGPTDKAYRAAKLSVAVLFTALVVTMATPGLADAAEPGFLTRTAT